MCTYVYILVFVHSCVFMHVSVSVHANMLDTLYIIFSMVFAFYCSPGPIYFINPLMTRKGKDGIPAYSLHDRTKSVIDSLSPGPGKR